MSYSRVQLEIIDVYMCVDNTTEWFSYLYYHSGQYFELTAETVKIQFLFKFLFR